MAMMKWTKPSAKTIAYFERLAPGPPIQARNMFGMPCRFLNGHMLVGVFQNTLMLHLSASDRLECIAAGAKPFAPMGREAKAYVDVAPGLFDDRSLKEWIVRGMRYLGSLPPKLDKKKSAPPAAAPASIRPAKPVQSSKPPAPPSKSAKSVKNVKSAKTTKATKVAKAPKAAKVAKVAKRTAAAKPSKAQRRVPGRGAKLAAKRRVAPTPATKRSKPKKKQN